MNKQAYIIQNMKQSSKLDLLFPKDDDLDWYFENEKNTIDISLNDLITSKNKCYMVVAEPGYGKTRLLKEIIIQSQGQYQAFFVDAKKIKQSSIDESLKRCKKEELLNTTEEKLQKLTTFKNTDDDFSAIDNTIVCIDALDEVTVSELYELMETIEEFIENNSEIKIFLSCRTHHLKKINFNFSSLDFKFITLNRFSNKHIQRYLENRLGKKIDLESMYKKSKMSNLIDFISIPRYLYYFSELLKEGSLDEIINMSRATMFENFIYRKLNKELQTDTAQSQIDLLKRVLEELALIMKINGTSEISKDELMTVFKKIDSNFSYIISSDDLIQKLYDRSLIKDNVDSIEFESPFFLDYLAAKELARFEKVEQVFFDIAIEPHILELYPSWFYVLPFVFELEPSIIELFLNFLNKNNQRIFSVEYFQALLNIEPENISKELKSKIFDMVFEYYTSHTKWLDAHRGYISSNLVRYYDNSKYQNILDSIDERKNKGNALTVLRTNAVRLISLIIEDNKLDENRIKFWQKKVSKWLNYEVKEYRYLHRNILEQFANLSSGNFDWIKKHRFIFETGIQVQSEYAKACFKVAPNDRFSIDVYLDTDDYWIKNKEDINLSKSNDEYDYIMKLNDTGAMKYALNKIWDNEVYHDRFCENLDRGIFYKRKIEQVREHLLSICNDELLIFIKELIVKSIDDNHYHTMSCKGLYKVIIEVIFQKDKSYIEEYINICEKLYETEQWPFYPSIFDYISIDFVSKHFNDFERAIAKIRNEKTRFNILEQIYRRAPLGNRIREIIISNYPSLISVNSDKIPDYEKERKEKACKDWIEKIEPEAGKFIKGLFEFFVNNKEDLKECNDYKKNYNDTVQIAKEVLKNNNPLKRGKVEKKENGGATIWQVDYYESCITFAYKEKLELDQDIRDNVFRYLPFNMNNDYETTMEVAKTPSINAIQDIVDVYAGKRDDDLGIYHVMQFVELYNKMKLSQFEPVLLKMLQNEKVEEYEKVYISQSLPSEILSAKIIRENKKKLNRDSDLYQEYLASLMQKHQDTDAVEEAFESSRE